MTLLGIFSFLIQCIFSTPRVDIINELYACENRELDSAFTSFQVFKLGFISGNLRITRWCFIFSIHVYFMSFHLCYNLEDLLINFFTLDLVSASICPYICSFIIHSETLLEFPDIPMARTLCFHCWGHRFDPWSGN